VVPFVGLADDSSAIAWNPAALARLKHGDLSLHHNSHFVDASQESLSLALASLGRPVLGLAGDWVNYGEFARPRHPGRSAEEVGSFRSVPQACLGGTFNQSLSWGLGVSYLSQSLGTDSKPELCR